MFSLGVETSKGEYLELTQNESEFQVVNVTGLNPVNANITRSVIAGLDGSRFNHARLEERNIVITLKLNGDVESNRHELYKYFSTKQYCKIYYKNKTVDVYIEGYVESNEVDLFSVNEQMQVSIICPNPYFKALEEVVIDISKTLALFEFPFSIDLEINPDFEGSGFTLGQSELGETSISSTENVYLEVLKQNLLNMTSYLETSQTFPDNFGITAGNFDGTGISWGAIQFNFGQIEANNTLSPIWKDLINNYPDICASCITDSNDYLFWSNLILGGSYQALKDWATSITDPGNNHKVIEPWNTYFKNLGVTQQSISRQLLSSEWYYELATTWFDIFDLWTRRGLGLCFDIAVQSGNISNDTIKLILDDFKTITPGTEAEIETKKLIIIANRKADEVNPTYQASYRERKLAIANGSGNVYGGTLFFDTANFDLILAYAFPEDMYIPVGIPFSEVEIQKVTTITNETGVETGLLINIDFTGICNKLLIKNVDTGETMILGYYFLEGDSVVINTNKGDKKIRLSRSGQVIDIFSSIKKGSVFFQLVQGDNHFSYSADDGATDDRVNIIFKHFTLFSGV